MPANKPVNDRLCTIKSERPAHRQEVGIPEQPVIVVPDRWCRRAMVSPREAGVGRVYPATRPVFDPH